MREQRQQSCERAEPCGEEDEEGELLLRVDRHLVEGGQQLAVGALGTTATEVYIQIQISRPFSDGNLRFVRRFAETWVQ